MNAQATTSSKTALGDALNTALQRIESAHDLAESLKALDAAIDETDDRLQQPEHQVRGVAARASLRGIDAPVREALLLAAGVAANARPMRDALIQMQVHLEWNAGAPVPDDAVAELAAALAAMNDALASLGDAGRGVCACSDRIAQLDAPLVNAEAAPAAQAAPPTVDVFWSFVNPNAGPVVKSQPSAMKQSNTAAAPIEIELPQIPGLYDLPQDLQRIVGLFQDVRQAMGCVIGGMRALA